MMIKQIEIKDESKISEEVNSFIKDGYKLINVFPYPKGEKQVIIAILEKTEKDNVIIG